MYRNMSVNTKLYHIFYTVASLLQYNKHNL